MTLSTLLARYCPDVRVCPDTGRVIRRQAAEQHVVTVTPDESDDSGILTYLWSCSCGRAFGRADTDAEARSTARDHAPDAQFTTRSEMPFEVLRGR